MQKSRPQIEHYIKIAKSIAKRLNSTDSPADDTALNTWLNESPENQEIYNTIAKPKWYHTNEEELKHFNSERGWQRINQKLTTKQVKIFRLPKVYKYAAAAILVIALATTYVLRDTIFNSQIENTAPIIVNNQIEPGIDKATLTLETGEEITLTKGTFFQTQNVTSNGEELIYNPTINDKQQTTNTLTIPRGGQFQVTLSDGTKVWLNSETQLKYPVSFTDGESRQVELVYGEAYFDVTHSTEYGGADFKVFHDQQEVQVLGTAFNVKAYKDETNIYTTLVEGMVKIATPSANEILSPNQQAIVNRGNNTLTINNTDVKAAIAWVNGEFIIQHKTLKEIMKVLSRWYDMDVTFTNKDLEDVRFVGILRKNQNIIDILNTIKNFNVIKDYEIHNKTVILK